MATHKDNWLDAMIEREALPMSLRKETTGQFCEKYGINESTYRYQRGKKENWEKILEIALMSAKKEVPDVLLKLAEKAKNGDTKAISIYLDYVVQLSKKLDLNIQGDLNIGDLLIKAKDKNKKG